MDRRVLIIRRWLLIIAALALCLAAEPGLWFCLFAAPIIWTRTSGGTTGILIHPDGSGGWKIAVGDSADATCACCGFSCAGCNPAFGGNYQVVISGVTNGSVCTGCSQYNGTWEVERGFNNNDCMLNFVIGGTPLGGASCAADGDLSIVVIDGANGALASFVRLNTANAEVADWQKAAPGLGLEPDCGNYSSESFPTTADTVLCNNASATALVTAL